MAFVLGAWACQEKAATTPPAKAPPAAAASAAAAAPAAAAPAAAPAEVPAAAGANDEKEAMEIYSMRCVPCHGAAGAGDGPASAALTPKPASFAAAEWQASVTDEHIEKVIMYGGAAVGKSPAMPPNPDLTSKEGVIKALRAHVRSLKK